MEIILINMNEVQELRERLEDLSVNTLMFLQDEIIIMILKKKHEMENYNAYILMAEVMHLMTKTSDGYRVGETGEKEHYMSTIKGVEDIRIYNAGECGYKKDTVHCYIDRPSGRLLPCNITIKGHEFDVVVTESFRYKDGIDY